MTYQLTYNANGGSGSAPATETRNAGTVVTLPGAGGLSRSGYTFAGWSRTSSGTAVSTVTLNADTAMFALWVKATPLNPS